MKKQQTSATEKTLEKYDNQLLNIISEDLRSVRYSRTKNLNPSGISSLLNALKSA
jgi:hypothetical protein